MDYKQKELYLRALQTTVREAGGAILNYKGPIVDTGYELGHETSTIDEYARITTLDRLESNFRKMGLKFEGLYDFELGSLRTVPKSTGPLGEQPLVLDMDEIDGTTNTKRAIAARILAPHINYAPKAGVCIALLESRNLGSILASAFYSFSYDATFSGIKTEETFTAYMDDVYLCRHKFSKPLGDDRYRIIVADYSNKNQIGIGMIRQALVKSKKFARVYGGCRSSSMDIIDIVLNQYDAYIDLRALWEDSGAMLQAFDVVAVVPVALGAGLEISDIEGRFLDNYTHDSSIPLVVGRPGIKDEILGVIHPVIEQTKQNWQQVRKELDISD